MKPNEVIPSETSESSEKEEETRPDDKPPDTTKPTDTKPSEPLDEPTHEEDKHVDKPSDVEKDASGTASAAQVCSDLKCRGSIMAALLGVLFVGIFVGRTLSSRSVSQYHGTELEVPTLHLDEDDAVDFSTRYRDHPEGEDEEDVVAEEGVGYEDDDDELDPHEIA